MIKTSASSSQRERAIEHFWETVPPLWGTIRAHIRAEAEGQMGISVEQFHVLRYVRHGVGSVSELAEAKNISRPAISQAVEALVKKGLLRRKQSTQDRRCVALELTPAGSQLLERVFAETRDWMRKRMQGISEQECADIIKGMQALNKRLK